MKIIQGFVLLIFFLMELFTFVIFGFWGFHVEKGFIIRIILGLGTPLAGAVIWGIFIAPKAVFPVSTGIRILLQLAFFSCAVAILLFSGHHFLGICFLVLVIIEIVAVNTAKFKQV